MQIYHTVALTYLMAMHILLQRRDQGRFNIVRLDPSRMEVIHFFPGS